MYRTELYTTVICLLAVSPAVAQEIDPTVEVSRTYQGKIIEVHKPMLEMQIPDSVTRFDLDFDYSVFDSPYKGTYEFTPYVQNMKPQPDAWTGRRLFLRAGAGYPLHPVFDFVWSPAFKGKFRMDIYAVHRSYIGKYRNILPVTDGNTGAVSLDSPRPSGGSSKGWNGYDSMTAAGIDGSLYWKRGIFSFDVGYYGLAAKDTLSSRGYNALDASLRLRSNDSRDRYFLYDVSLDYRYGADNLDYRDEAIGLRSLSGHEFSLNSVFGPVFSSASRLTIGLGLDMESYSSAFGTSSGKVTVRPAYSIDKGRWNFDLGVKFSAMFRGGENGLLPAQNVRKGQYVYPDIEVGYEIVRDYLEVYADIGGGEKTGRYSDLIEKSHYIRPFYTLQSNSPLLDNTVERVSVSLGFRGNISSRFIYDLKTGYRNFANAPLYAVVAGSEDLRDGFFTTLGYTGFQMFYASLDYGWESADFSLDGNFTYRSTDVAGKVSAPDVLNSIMAYFSPAAFSGDIRAMYNWHGRIYAGADCDFSLARESALCSTAGYADLGMYVEIRAARLFSFWLRGGNLLNMTVQRTPMYAESGINFTAGICLNL